MAWLSISPAPADRRRSFARDALLAFVRDSARDLTTEIARVESVAFSLENDHLAGKGVLKAGDMAQIETRALKKGDCVCTNEMVYYQPLTKVQDFSPAYTRSFGYSGDALNNRWLSKNQRSSFLATFRR